MHEKMSNMQNNLINVHKNVKLQKTHFLLLLNFNKRNVKFGTINL